MEPTLQTYFTRTIASINTGKLSAAIIFMSLTNFKLLQSKIFQSNYAQRRHSFFRQFVHKKENRSQLLNLVTQQLSVAQQLNLELKINHTSIQNLS